MLLSVYFTKQFLTEASLVHLLGQIAIGGFIFAVSLLLTDKPAIVEIKSLILNKRNK